MMDLEFMKTPVIFAAIITGSLTAFGLIKDWFFASSKSRFESKTIFEKSLQERIESIYTPLIMRLNTSCKKAYLIDDEVKQLIHKYGYLLSNQVLFDLIELIRIEEQEETREIEFKEYQHLRSKIIKEANKEFTELQNLHNKNFSMLKRNLMSPAYIKVVVFLEKISMLFAGVFWFMLIIFLNIEPIEITQNQWFNMLFPVLLLILALMSGFALIILFIKAFDLIQVDLKRLRKLFSSGEYAPETGNYKCKVCNEIRFFYKNEVFPPCKSKRSFKNSLYINEWSFDKSHNNMLCKELEESV